MATTDQINTRKIRELSEKVDTMYKEFAAAMNQALGPRSLEEDECEDESPLAEALAKMDMAKAMIEAKNKTDKERVSLAAYQCLEEELKESKMINGEMVEAFKSIVETAIEFANFTKEELTDITGEE